VITLALVLTPIPSAPALATLLGLGGIDVDVVPTSRGAVVVRAVGTPEPEVPEDASALTAQEPILGPAEEGAAAEPSWDIAELFDDDVPPEARELAATISRLTRLGVVLVTVSLSTDAGTEPGISGQVRAQRYEGGEPGEDVPGGLVIAGADDVVEELLLGRRSVTDVPGHVRSAQAAPPKGRWFGRGRRRPRP
jgi:hypothetical protein